MSVSQDEDEHSLEMHLPYIYAIFANDTPPNPAFDQWKHVTVPPLVPIMVGATNAAKEKEYGRLLAPYVANPENLFIISSDFCHWYCPLLLGKINFRGTRFQYTYYNKENHRLTYSTPPSTYSSPPIYKAIETLDHEGMKQIESGNYESFLSYLSETGNTICGRFFLALPQSNILATPSE